MVDDVRIEAAIEDGVSAARLMAEKIEKGEPGECDLCGEWAGRLINGACAPCRDRYGLV